MKIHTNDEVLVIAGKDRGKHGRVIRVLKDKGKVVVDGVNIIVRHMRRNPQNPSSGGRVKRPAPIDVSNVMAWSAAEEKAVRVRYEGSGKTKHRVSVASGKVLTTGGGRKAKKAKKGDSSPSEE